MRRWVLAIVCLLIAGSVAAQKEKVVSVEKIRGEYAVVLTLSDITGREAMQRARDDAKQRAIEQVCGQRINVWEQMEISSAGDKFNSLSLIQTDGEIVDFEVVDEGVEVSQLRSGETIYYCVANVKVKRGGNYDPEFRASINGIRSVYQSDDLLTFKVVPTKDCYMKLFLLADGETGYALYPNSYDRGQMLLANEEFDIAKNNLYEFYMTIAEDCEKETNRLVFVFTKKNYVFDNQVTSRSEIEKWIAEIPNNEKFLSFHIMEICR